MKMMKLGLLLLCHCIVYTSFAQVAQHSGWFASFNTIKLSDKWGIHAELQIRSTDDWQQVQSILPRIGLNYQVAKNQVLTAGCAYIPNRVTVGSNSGLLGEHRIWQQYLINQPVGKITVAHRFRLEERFTPKGILDGGEVKVSERVYSTRFRYFIRAIIPFTKQRPFVKGAFIALQNEAFVNITDKQNVNGRFFDQNRAYVAFGYRFSKKMDIEAGYMNQYVQRTKAQANVANHIAQLATYLRL